jgi:general secretion pathway protein L
MSVLIVLLPASTPDATTEYRYAQTRDGQTVSTHGRAIASAMPLTNSTPTVVAVVPVRALSWHQVALPKGTLNGGAVRLRAVLDGLLEEHLLDEPQNLHFALAPNASTDAPVWVAVCDKAWLHTALRPLEAAGCSVSRIVPELAPQLSHSTNVAEGDLYALGEPGAAWLVQTHAQGVTMLPLPTAATAQALHRTMLGTTDHLTNHQRNVLAEPAVADLANKLFNNRVTLQQAQERWLAALQSSWDLAQFGLANSGHQRFLKKLSSVWFDLVHAPRWRAARWGTLVLLAANLIGLNAWAWKEKAALTLQRRAIQDVLTQTFPHVKVVVDAPVQMSRELSLLKQTAGTVSRQDFENLLTAVGSTVPATESLNLSQISYSEGELRLKGPRAQGDKIQALQAQLSSQGYAMRMDGDSLVLKVESEVRP